MRRAVYWALLATLVAMPAAAQDQAAAPQQQIVIKKAAPVAPDMDRLMLYELRIQQYADRIATAADKGESMGVVYNSMDAIADCLTGGSAQLAALMKVATATDAKHLATVQLQHAQAQNAYNALKAELKKDPISRAAVLRTAYKLSDAAVRAQGNKPKAHPIIKATPN